MRGSCLTLPVSASPTSSDSSINSPSTMALLTATPFSIGLTAATRLAGWAICSAYVRSGPGATGRVLDVHKLHLRLGRLGSKHAHRWLEANVPRILVARKENDAAPPYCAAQSSDDGTKFLKHRSTISSAWSSSAWSSSASPNSRGDRLVPSSNVTEAVLDAHAAFGPTRQAQKE